MMFFFSKPGERINLVKTWQFFQNLVVFVKTWGQNKPGENPVTLPKPSETLMFQKKKNLGENLVSVPKPGENLMNFSKLGQNITW